MIMLNFHPYKVLEKKKKYIEKRGKNEDYDGNRIFLLNDKDKNDK